MHSTEILRVRNCIQKTVIVQTVSLNILGLKLVKLDCIII